MNAITQGPFLDCRSITAGYGSRTVVRDLDLAVGEGELIGLLGPSGCGKTTLLRVIAGLSPSLRGSVHVGGTDITRVPAHRRNFGVVFQSYALFPHLDTTDNVAFGLKARGVASGEARREAEHYLDLVQLTEHRHSPVTALSGGQQQRVAVARALATRPPLLLLDEPFSALDRRLRADLQIELRRLLRQVGVTAIFVTHDQTEAFALCDRIAVMQAGGIEQIDRPEVLYNRPATPFVLGFVGLATRMAGTVAEKSGDGCLVTTAYGRFDVPRALAPGSSVTLAIRPEKVIVSPAEPPAEATAVRLVYRDSAYLGGMHQLTFAAEGDDHLSAIVPEDVAATLAPGAAVSVAFRRQDLIVLPSAP
ncbi:MAG TPA: ABC transporter ATP-binding protein [Bauldia sp.]|nr:ABC transporter ATP-binding protein [Bauldia sp.]